MNAQAQNIEEAANIATEYIYSIDNLPNEVKFLLEEIKFKDDRVQTLQQELDSDGAKYIRHGLRANGTNADDNSKAFQAKIIKFGGEIQRLSQEKVTLALRLVELIERTRLKLDADLHKMRILQGEVKPTDLRRSVPPTPTLPSTARLDSGINGRDAASKLSESLRSALMPPPMSASDMHIPQATPQTPATPASASTAGPPTKKRRTNSSYPSIKLPATGTRSASPAAPPPAKAAHAQPATTQRSRLARQVTHTHTNTTKHDVEIESPDADADGGDAEGDDDDEHEDDTPYCFCQRPSFGEMIGCDNDHCRYEWFHLACVGLKSTPGEDQRWYCPDCSQKLGVGNEDSGLRKARKR